jgi:hypothetical protein
LPQFGRAGLAPGRPLRSAGTEAGRGLAELAHFGKGAVWRGRRAGRGCASTSQVLSSSAGRRMRAVTHSQAKAIKKEIQNADACQCIRGRKGAGVM